MTPRVKYFSIPNLLSATRLAGAVCLIFLTPLSPAFYTIYTVCGVTDALDGFIARATNSVTSFGSRLDSVADLSFYTVMMIRMLPEMWRVLPRKIWFVVGLILLLRVTGYVVEAVRFRRFASPHTILNKITGAMMFGIPYLIRTKVFVWYAFAICAVGLVSAVSELILHIKAQS